MKLILASKNAHKAKEMQAILGESVELITQDSAGFGDIDVVEDGATFEENAIKKATALSNASGLSAIADDSGLCVDYLDGRPGVYTARFAGENATDDENIDKLLAEMEGVEKEKRTARFVSAVCLYMPDGRNTVCRGTCEGWIGWERIGDGGFGYDPVFMVEETSYSQMSPEAKDAISHRGSALRQLKEKISEFI